ncbi:MAG: alpha-galactosidase, partial [Thermoguttaceae bacterium]|nr:alpha-galactosidase [Thermoguttaceae bacterium]
THPTGDLLPIANAVHQSGMKFLLWFEPERIRANAPILKTHPEYRMDDLLRLDDPEAFHWIQNTIYEIIDKHNIDIYRQDFNINPGPIWKKIDGQTSDRVGITEAKYIAALYRYMDEMRVRFPGILQENCASGGRRLDIEMIMRAHSYCRSDYFIDKKPGETAINLGQNATLNLLPYLPFQGGESNGVLLFDDYAMMSFVSSGTVFTPTDFNGGIIRREFSKEETQWFKKTISLAERMRPFYLGDFFPLTDETGPTDHVWCGWQLDRADLGAGFILVFRRTQAAEATKSFLPGHIEPKAKYELELFDGSKKIIPGSELANLKIDLAPRSFFLAFYKKMSEK